tara:strand:- start:3144 stop:4145 length:1002 start_codon:yes stop_codon:yes gene_type:complete
MHFLVVQLLPLVVELVQQEIEMALGILGDCLPEGNPLDKGARQIIDKVMNGGAFKNPQADGIDLTSGKIGGINFDPITDPAGALATQMEAINTQLSNFKTHTAKLSGTGDVGEFSKIMGIASSFNKAKSTLENSTTDNFSGMFGSIIDGGAKVSELDEAVDAISRAVLAGEDQATITNLVNQATTLGNNIDALKTADEAAFNSGFAYVVKQGIGQGIASVASPDGDCFAKALLENHIGTDSLKGAMNVENFTDTLKETLPDVSEIDMANISSGVGGEEAAAAAERSATATNIASLQTEVTSLKSRTTSVESSLGLKSEDTHDHTKIDGGSYGI